VIPTDIADALRWAEGIEELIVVGFDGTSHLPVSRVNSPSLKQLMSATELRVIRVDDLDPGRREGDVRRVCHLADDALHVAVAHNPKQIAATSANVLHVDQARSVARDDSAQSALRSSNGSSRRSWPSSHSRSKA
jgi:hypothetical protein